jgi:hypothetical protein
MILTGQSGWGCCTQGWEQAQQGQRTRTQGGEMLAGPKPYGTSAGGIAVAVAVICFSIAGYFWWQYRKGTFPGNKKSALTAAHQHAR